MHVCVRDRERKRENEREKRQINVTQIFWNDIYSFPLSQPSSFRDGSLFSHSSLHVILIPILCPSWKDVKYVTYAIIFPGTPILLRTTGCWRTRLCFQRGFLHTDTYSEKLREGCCAARYLHPAITDKAGLLYLHLHWSLCILPQNSLLSFRGLVIIGKEQTFSDALMIFFFFFSLTLKFYVTSLPKFMVVVFVFFLTNLKKCWWNYSQFYYKSYVTGQWNSTKTFPTTEATGSGHWHKAKTQTFILADDTINNIHQRAVTSDCYHSCRQSFESHDSVWLQPSSTFSSHC